MHELLCGTQSIFLIRLLRVRDVVQKRIVGDGNTEKGFFEKGLILLWREGRGFQGGNKESKIFHTNESTGKVLLTETPTARCWNHWAWNLWDRVYIPSLQSEKVA